MSELTFKEWAHNTGALFSSDISELEGVTVGIDAEEYLAGLLISEQREPLLPALGGLPFSLRDRVDQDIEHFSDAGIRPMFVFNGLDLACKDRASILRSSLRATENLESAWSIYDSGKGDEAVKAFGRACRFDVLQYGNTQVVNVERIGTHRIYHILRNLMAHLHGKGVRVFTAPYAAASQLVYMEENDVISAIQGSASPLVFGADQVILDFDWNDEKKFHFCSIERVTEKLGVSKEQFNDICLLSGASILQTLPELEAEHDRTRFESARMLLQRSGNDAVAACVSRVYEEMRTLAQCLALSFTDNSIGKGPRVLDPASQGALRNQACRQYARQWRGLTKQLRISSSRHPRVHWPAPSERTILLPLSRPCRPTCAQLADEARCSRDSTAGWRTVSRVPRSRLEQAFASKGTVSDRDHESAT